MNLIQQIKLYFKIKKEWGKIQREVKKMDTKKWWQSKTIWSIVFAAAVNIIQAIKPELLSSPIAISLTAIATAFGIYGRVDANTHLTK